MSKVLISTDTKSDFFNEEVDEVKFFDVIQTANEISGLYSAK